MLVLIERQQWTTWFPRVVVSLINERNNDEHEARAPFSITLGNPVVHCCRSMCTSMCVYYRLYYHLYYDC